MSYEKISMEVSPQRCLWDEGLGEDGEITVRLPSAFFSTSSEVVVKVTAKTHHRNGKVWTSFAHFTATEEVLHIHKAVPRDDFPASFQGQVGVPSSFQYSMTTADAEGGMGYRSLKDTSIEFEATAVGSEGAVATATVVRVLMEKGVTREEVRGDEGSVVFLPSGTKSTDASSQTSPAVMFVPGSSGCKSAVDMAALLASRGYVAFIYAYAGWDADKRTLCEIPLEDFSNALNWLKALPCVNPAAVSAVGISVGTAGTLAAAALLKGDQAFALTGGLMLLGPTNCVWQGFKEGGGRPPETSAWSMNGSPLPYVPMEGYRLLPQIARRFIASKFPFKLFLEQRDLDVSPSFIGGYAAEGHEDGRIPVEDIKCPLFTVAGGQDGMWPASKMMEDLASRRRNSEGDVALEYPTAGHCFTAPGGPTTANRVGVQGDGLVVGGEMVGTMKANADWWPRYLEWLGTFNGV